MLAHVRMLDCTKHTKEVFGNICRGNPLSKLLFLLLVLHSAVAFNPSGQARLFRTCNPTDVVSCTLVLDKRSQVPPGIPESLAGYLQRKLAESLNRPGAEVRALELFQELSTNAPEQGRIAWIHEHGTRLASCIKHNPVIVESLSEGRSSIMQVVRLAEERAQAGQVILKHHAVLRQAAESTPLAWTAAISNQSALQGYGEAALEMGRRSWVRSGISWCADTILDHFHCGGAAQRAHKDERRQHYLETGSTISEEVASELVTKLAAMTKARASCPVRVLDVGACGYLFEGFEGIECTALDLCPQDKRTYRADFLNLQVGRHGSAVQALAPLPGENCAGELLALPAASYDAVILSLVLSYLPLPSQRAAMVAQARRLLIPPRKVTSPNPCFPGLLLVVDTRGTTGAEHQDGNAVTREWIRSIESLCFRVVKRARLGKMCALAFEVVPLNGHDDSSVENDCDFRELEARVRSARILTRSEWQSEARHRAEDS